MSTQKNSVAVKPIAPYVGGKTNLARDIIKKIESIPHKSYAEPFVGMGGIFLRRRVKAPYEMVNDFNNDVANLFRIIQRHEEAFLHSIQHMISSRHHFQIYFDIPPHTLTDIDKAVRFFYLQKLVFGGKVGSKSYGVSKCGSSRFNPQKIKKDIHALSTRLSGVTIESLDFEDFIQRYDHKDMLFYIDPPYFKCENYYGKNLFCREDFNRLENILRKIRGKFLFSINDTPEIRHTFKKFSLEVLKTRYSISKDTNKTVSELLISNLL